MEWLSLYKDRYNEAYGVMLEKMDRSRRFREWAEEVFPALKRMEWLSLYKDRYNEAYGVMLEKMDRSRRFREWAEEVFPSTIVQKLASSQGDDDGTFRSLGVGSGNGEYELHLLKQLSTRFPRINHVVIEPSKEFIQAYQAELATSSFKGSVQFTWHEGTFQDYKQKALGGRFDFISAIHSLYYAENAVEAVDFLYQSLAPGGIFMIEMSDDKSSGQKMLEDFPELQQMFTHIKWVSNSDVTAALRDMNIPFSPLVNPIPLEITDIFNESSHEGNLLLDFFTHVSNFRKTADEGLVKRVMEFLKMKADGQTVDQTETGEEMTVDTSDGKKSRLYFKKIWETLIIQKP